MKKALFLFFVVGLCLFGFRSSVMAQSSVTWWPVQSIDTMKFSRDLARQELKDQSFDKTIDTQVKDIAETGATHVAIATPYDDEFLPFLKRWVKSARKYHLKVWFRGNFSGWEGWFNYSPLSRSEHQQKTVAFILKNKDLFEDGDIFTACPECENGGPGDPRQTDDVDGFRRFMISEYQATKSAFAKIGKNVVSNFDSMNADVARLVMDHQTTVSMNGLVVIDHYLASPQQLVRDVDSLASSSGGRVFLGEFGAPIPNLNGYLSEKDQSAWIRAALTPLINDDHFFGLNYWVGFGGSTQLWNDDGSPRAAVATLRSFFSPIVIRGLILNATSDPIANAAVSLGQREVLTDNKGAFALPYPPQENDRQLLKASASGYKTASLEISDQSENLKIKLEKANPNIFDLILLFLYQRLGI